MVTPYSKGVLLVEGISEALLIPTFCHALGYRLEDYRIELVNVEGISFYPFLMLFNSSRTNKRLPKLVSVITDDDRFPDSKNTEYSFDKLLENNYETLDKLYQNISAGEPTGRVANLNSFANGQAAIRICSAYKTLEYAIAFHNVTPHKADIETNVFVDYIKQTFPENFRQVSRYYETLPDGELSSKHRSKTALLLWKTIPSKSEFAQDFAAYLAEEISRAETTDHNVSFVVPPHISDALNHLVTIGI